LLRQPRSCAWGCGLSATVSWPPHRARPQWSYPSRCQDKVQEWPIFSYLLISKFMWSFWMSIW
jgi:hypothetical protein